MDKIREEFEAWVVTCRFFKKLNAHLKQNSDGSYGCYAVNDRWMAWQAARQMQEHGGVVAYIITDSDGVRIARLAEHVEPNRLIAVNVQPLYALHTPPGRAADLREQRIRAGMAEASLETRTRHLQSCEIALSERDARIAALESQLAESEKARERMWELAEGARRAFAWFSEQDGGEVAAQLYKEYDEALTALAAEKGN